MKLPKVYEPAEYESDIYALWEKSGAFLAHPEKRAERFSISMPPPNATGTLHLGHSLGIAIQDAMVRYARMQGKDTLWLPGTDHAALPVNAIMEKQLADEGTNKHEVGREEFLRRIREFVDNSQDTIRNQVRAMGASTDWTRERYTLDDALSRSVNETFVKMYNSGLIYRGHRIVNWDPTLETTVSDDEVVRQEEKATFYTFKYGPFEISTARPETKFGDKYVVMHPDDKRYKEYKHGQTFEAEWINGKVMATVIKDEAVDPEFGTGVMTITPWHDVTDFEIAERHKLDKEQIIDYHGRLLPIAEEFAGLPIEKARPLIVEKLKEKGLLVKVDENYMHSIALNDRGKGVIEPQIKLQWFVDVNKKAVEWKGKKRSLKEVMRAVIDDKDVQIIPKRFDKTYFHWIDNLRDWCISRQIWWGHRIPVWYRKGGDGKAEVYVGVKPPEEDDKGAWKQDPDTLDTWFSSALWTWSTLLDPKLATDLDMDFKKVLKKSLDFQTYHPTSVMETGWDILFFWVARMILATTFMIGEVPFRTVYLHGLVRNDQGQKMSKSKPETAIDPLKIIPEYGTDALRLALVANLSAGNDQRLSMNQIAAQRNFCNKLWNVARYIEANIGDDHHLKNKPDPKTAADYWVLSKLQHTTGMVTTSMDNFRFAEAYGALYHFVWDDFADWYIEASKGEVNASVLAYSLDAILRLLHPFAPFVTETIWQTLKWEGDNLLITSRWPSALKVDAKPAKNFEELKNIITEIRHIQSVLMAHDVTLYYTDASFITENAKLITRMARLKQIMQVTDGHGLHLTSTPYKAWLDIDHENIMHYQTKLAAKHAEQLTLLGRLEARLANKSYVKSAPRELVEQTQIELREAKTLLDNIAKELESFSVAERKAT